MRQPKDWQVYGPQLQMPKKRKYNKGFDLIMALHCRNPFNPLQHCREASVTEINIALPQVANASLWRTRCCVAKPQIEQEKTQRKWRKWKQHQRLCPDYTECCTAEAHLIHCSWNAAVHRSRFLSKIRFFCSNARKLLFRPHHELNHDLKHSSVVLRWAFDMKMSNIMYICSGAVAIVGLCWSVLCSK